MIPNAATAVAAAAAAATATAAAPQPWPGVGLKKIKLFDSSSVSAVFVDFRTFSNVFDRFGKFLDRFRTFSDRFLALSNFSRFWETIIPEKNIILTQFEHFCENQV